MGTVITTVGTTITAAILALSALFSSSAPAQTVPNKDTQTVTISICGQGGIVPPNADGTPAKKCNK
jgi:hypothetical protein